MRTFCLVAQGADKWQAEGSALVHLSVSPQLLGAECWVLAAMQHRTGQQKEEQAQHCPLAVSTPVVRLAPDPGPSADTLPPSRLERR